MRDIQILLSFELLEITHWSNGSSGTLQLKELSLLSETKIPLPLGKVCILDLAQ